jgi:DNA-binding response OmpR family regulator
MTTNLPVLLIVDDNRDNRTLLARRLERQSYEVITVDSGLEALQVLGKQTCDLVLLDILMRDMDGMETLKNIRREYSLLELPVIMVSALAESKNIVEALQAGANDYVTKPLDIDVILARIQTQLTLSQ